MIDVFIHFYKGTGLQAQAVFKNKLSFRPHSTASQTHRKMTMSIAERMNKAQKVKMMPAMERDPESQRENALKVDKKGNPVSYYFTFFFGHNMLCIVNLSSLRREKI